MPRRCSDITHLASCDIEELKQRELILRISMSTFPASISFSAAHQHGDLSREKLPQIPCTRKRDTSGKTNRVNIKTHDN